MPHIYAGNEVDLFFAQGFVQAQDRLFQMDLWRRASQGRLSEILGANFIDRDAMTRRIQYSGDRSAEWASYPAGAEAIADAFVRGINAWVSIARDRLPEEFVQARWPPAYWRADDLLNRTDAFLESSGAQEDVRRKNLPSVVADALRLVGTQPFVAGAAPSDAMTAVRTPTQAKAADSRVTLDESPGTLTAPSKRYLVHLVAPGWNVIGATAPWLPGIADGHNDRVAWAMAPIAVDTQEVMVERADTVTVSAPELMRVKGRAQVLPFTRDTTPDGLVIASDRERQRVYVLRWRGFEPGMASGLDAFALDRARDASTLREAAAHWNMPSRRVVFNDVEGHAGEFEIGVRGVRGAQGLRPSGRDDRSAESVALHDDRAAVIFPHLFRRFDIGPLRRPNDDAPVRLDLDVSEWDRSKAISAPGQSGAPSSTHYADAAARWAAGEWMDLWFSDAAVRAHAESTLTLTPAPRP